MAFNVVAYYNYLFSELADPRTKDWLLTEPWVPVIVIILYLFLILYLLPKYMKQRKPYDLIRVIQSYNVCQIFACFYILYGAYGADRNQYWFGCYPTDYSNNPMALRTLYFCWVVLLTKCIDLLETIFFVLRKKNEQVSTLHVYHHVTTVISVWVALKYVGGGVAVLPGIMNAFVHAIMYSYYFLSTTGPKTRAKLARVKPIVTIVQIIQLCMIIATGFLGLMPGCGVSIMVAWLCIPNIIVQLILFVDYYLRTFVRKPKKKL